MALHAQFTIDTGLQIYICDRSPWQRDTNENTNGPLRPNFPKDTNLNALSQDELDAVAAELNGRPRQALGWSSPWRSSPRPLRQPLEAAPDRGVKAHATPGRSRVSGSH